MGHKITALLIILITLLSFRTIAQTSSANELLGLPGDNLNLYAVLDLFQESKTIEDFEKSLNLETSGVNNLDLNKDDKVDFIKVETNQEGDDFLFVLQDPISKTETQDVAVIMVTKDENKNISLQIVGDEELYGKNYVIEPKAKASPGITPNPAYQGEDPVIQAVPATTQVIVETVPIVQYVYSPAYVPYYPPYYYGYYPPYFAAFSVMAIGIYHHNHYYNHYGYNNNIYINNSNHYDHYNKNERNTSNTVRDNSRNGNYNSASSRPTTNQNDRSSTANRPSTAQSKGSTASTRPSPSSSNRSSYGGSSASRPNSSNQTARASSSRSYSGGASARGGGGRRR
ncbi:MAG: hypothetical protein WBN19_03715 [Lutimonas sp.]